MNLGAAHPRRRASADVFDGLFGSPAPLAANFPTLTAPERRPYHARTSPRVTRPSMSLAVDTLTDSGRSIPQKVQFGLDQ
jgi:hypothetical protein